MNVVDSSGWLEYFAGGPNAGFFAPAIEKTGELLVPVITIYEVYKRISQQRDETAALNALAAMRQGEQIALDEGIALTAARLSISRKLPMADALIYATARTHDALLWTQNRDLEGLPGVRFREKR